MHFPCCSWLFLKNRPFVILLESLLKANDWLNIHHNIFHRDCQVAEFFNVSPGSHRILYSCRNSIIHCHCGQRCFGLQCNVAGKLAHNLATRLETYQSLGRLRRWLSPICLFDIKNKIDIIEIHLLHSSLFMQICFHLKFCYKIT